MKIAIDTTARTLTVDERRLDLYSKEAFEILSLQWVRVGWSLRYDFNHSWFGQQILQLPEDLVRVQEVIYRLRPSLIVETGVYNGGSLLFYATICQALGHGRVAGIDQRILPEVREGIDRHALSERISMIEGDSLAKETYDRVAALVEPGQTVLVLLDSCHEKKHVAGELELYSKLVTPGSYIVAADGIMRDLTDVPGGDPNWDKDNPLEAANEFVARHPEFVQEQPAWPCRRGDLTENITYWPGGWLRRR